MIEDDFPHAIEHMRIHENSIDPTSSPASAKKKKKRSKKKSVTTDPMSGANPPSLIPKDGIAKASGTSSNAKGKKNGADSGPSVLRLARNKHWKYVSSFYGQWLSLPIEMLETLYSSNAAPMPGIPIDHAQAATNMPWSYNTSASSATDSSARRRRTQLDPRRNRPSATASYGQSSASNRNTSANSTTSASDDGTISLTIPPPIDPGVFRSLKEIRRLVDDAADLALRAASGIVGPSGPSPDIAFLAGGNTYGSGTNGNNTNSNPGGRKSTLSTLRLNRMRAQAVEKLAAAYRIDEVATCVMVMKGTSALEDLADRVLRQGEFYLLYAQSPAHLPSADSSNIDAQYVRFFHQKVPSSPRQLCDTTTEPLDALIAARPGHLAYYRTRGVVQCFLEQYDSAIRDFTYGLVEARKVRKASRHERHDADVDGDDVHQAGSNVAVHSSRTGAHGKRTKKKGVSIEELADDSEDANPDAKNKLHHSLGPSAPDPLESQFLFHRASAYLAHAISTIERTVLTLEEMPFPAPESPEIRLSTLSPFTSYLSPFFSAPSGTLGPLPKYGGVDLDSILGPRTGVKWRAYRRALNEDSRLKESVNILLRKSIRDFERFLGHFDSIVVPENASPPTTMNGSSPSQMHNLPKGSILPSAAFRSGIPSPLPPTSGKGKEVATGQMDGSSSFDYFYSPIATSGSITIPIDPSRKSTTHKDSMSPAASKQMEAFLNGTGPATLAIPLPMSSGSGSTQGTPSSTAIASALYDALQSQLGNSPLTTALLEQLPAVAARAIETVNQLDQTSRSSAGSQSAKLIGSPTLTLVSSLEGNQANPEVASTKWKDIPLPKRVGFSFFVTDCLRASPTSIPAASMTTSGATHSSSYPAPPLSPSPELERTFPVALTTYHPLLIDAHFSILIALMLLGDIPALLEAFVRSAVSLDGADGYPIFSPARSMAQADFNEILERLCAAWQPGKTPPAKSDEINPEASSSGASQGGPSGSAASSSRSARPSDFHALDDGVDPKQKAASENLDAMRILMAPVYRRLAQNRQTGAQKGRGMPLMLLCSPRVDIVIAWLAATHLPDWEDTIMT